MKSLEFDDLPLISTEAVVHFGEGFPLLGLSEALRFAELADERGQRLAVQNARLGRENQAVSYTPGINQILALEIEGPATGQRLIVQEDAFLSGWFKPVEGDAGYVRYPALRSQIEWAIETLRSLHPSAQPQATLVNLHYRSLIPTRDSWAESAVVRYLRPEYRPPMLSGPAEPQGYDLRWQTPSGIQRRLQMLQASMNPEAGLDSFILSTVAGKNVATNEDPLAVLDTCHNDLQIMFRDLISDVAKKEWGYVAND